MSSMAAVTPSPGQSCYSACKAGLNAYCQALSYELRPRYLPVVQDRQVRMCDQGMYACLERDGGVADGPRPCQVSVTSAMTMLVPEMPGEHASSCCAAAAWGLLGIIPQSPCPPAAQLSVYTPGLTSILLRHCKSCHSVVSYTGLALHCLHLDITGQCALHGIGLSAA